MNFLRAVNFVVEEILSNVSAVLERFDIVIYNQFATVIRSVGSVGSLIVVSQVDSFCESEESVSVREKCWGAVSWLSSLLLGLIVDGDRVSAVRFSCPCSALCLFSCC